MLKAFRQKKNIKRIMFFTAILIIPAFVFWGVGSVFSSRSKNALAGKVFSKKISRQAFFEPVSGCLHSGTISLR